MKKFSIFLASLLTGVAAIAQTQPVENPNRLIMTDAAQATKAYVLDRVSELSFARVDGDVKADVQVLSATTQGITLSVTRSEACMSFKIAVLPFSTALLLSDPAVAVNYINSNCQYGTYSEDFAKGTLSGMELTPGGEYSVMTIGIDEYGCEDGVCRADFTIPSVPVTGDPKVECVQKDRQYTSFSVECTPNADVSKYYCVAAEKGELLKQYAQFGPGMGFSCVADMIRSWGMERQGTQVIEWKDMAPNTDYEMFVLALDTKGNPAPYQVFECSTLDMGGAGEAKVTITPGEYVLANWNDQMLPSQFFTFTPNDQASCFRFAVYPKEQYEEYRDEIRSQLCSDPDMPVVYWFFYFETKTDFQIDPGSTVVALGAAKNINGEWGPITELEYTTAAQVDAAASKTAATSRPVPQRRAFRPGYVPSFGMGGKVSLTH